MIFLGAQIVVAILLIVVILLQMQGSGLSNAFGGGGEFYRSRQSLERILVVATIFLTIFFGILSVILLLPH